MKKIIFLISLFICFGNAIAQADHDKIIVVQKLYFDTLKTDYRKVKFEISPKADSFKRMDYSSAHITDTLRVKSTTEGVFDNGRFSPLNAQTASEPNNIENYKVGDTIFEVRTDYLSNNKTITLIKKVYSKDKLIYAARSFPKRQTLPYNELKYFYNKNGDLIKIQELYNSETIEEYETVFKYKNGVVASMVEYKKLGEKWIKEKVWEYDLFTKNKLKPKVARRINTLLLDFQFIQTPW